MFKTHVPNTYTKYMNIYTEYNQTPTLYMLLYIAQYTYAFILLYFAVVPQASTTEFDNSWIFRSNE